MYTKKINHEEKQLELANMKTKFHYELKYLSEYLSFTGELTQKKDEQLSQLMVRDCEENEEAEAILQGLFEKEKDALLSYYHHSAIVLVYTIFESMLADVCSEVHRFAKAGFTHNCLSGGNLIAKSKTYLELTTNMPFGLIQGEWARIGQFQKLRNMIVHQNSCFSGSKSSMEDQKNKIRNNFNSIKVSEAYNRFYILDDVLVYEFISLVKAFVNKIIEYLESVVFMVEKANTEPDMTDIPF
ncbi:hypothetical protein ACCH70_004240 [Vibrio vulnificus]|nr:hypothetical protein [Vibrio vulnificus]EHH0684977.1 hypothetical protein [Vibrio vulnificus]EHU9521010.1 hypothetical protein [Vibrio vulnificus]EHV9037638.1 hypothetical protein [Vibrio vulnificus]EIA1304917.1 hypothetical protein [Vibrio vulnificus]